MAGLNNDLLSNGVVVNPNPDAVAEFRVIESSYAAEYGRNAGGIVSIVTKSGTNELSTEPFTIMLSQRLFSMRMTSFFNQQGPASRGLEAPKIRPSPLVAPIVIPHIVNGRNKLFFFFSYQGQKQNQVSA